MQVERVDEVVLEDVDQVEPHQRVARDRDRLVHVGERDAVGRVDLVGAVEVRVEPVHHHHELVGVGAPLLGVDEEGAVEALGDVRRQRRGVAVVEVQAEGLGVELVDGRAAGLDQAGAGSGHAVHVGGVDAVEVDRVRVVRGVAEADPQPLALTGAQRGPGDAAVVGPGGERDAGRDLDLLLGGDQLPLAQRRGRWPGASSCPRRSRARSRSGRSRCGRGRPGRRGESSRARRCRARFAVAAWASWPPAAVRVLGGGLTRRQNARGGPGAEQRREGGERSPSSDRCHRTNYGIPKPGVATGWTRRRRILA